MAQLANQGGQNTSFFPLWSKKSVNYVKNLLDENFNQLTYEAFI